MPAPRCSPSERRSPRRAVGEAERGATVGHRLSVGYDEVTAIKVFLGTLVGFLPLPQAGLSRQQCGKSPRYDGDVVVVGPVVRVSGGQRGACVVDGGGRHVVCLHRAVHQGLPRLHTLPIAVHRGTGAGGGYRGGFSPVAVKTMGVPSAPSGRKPASSSCRRQVRGRALQVQKILSSLYLLFYYSGSFFRCGRNFFRPTVYCFLKVGNAL